VTIAEWFEANRNWQAMFPTRYLTVFANMHLYVTYEYSYREGGYLAVTKEVHDKIMMLNSPHAYTLMKAFIARTGYKDDPEKPDKK
jgi:hypothetical protein